MISKYTMQAIVCLVLLLLCSCGAASDDDYVSKTRKAKSSLTGTAGAAHKYAVYVENSLSINGYLNVSGDSSFKSNVYAFLSDINALADKRSLALYDVNTTIIAVDTDADASSLNAYNRKLDAAVFKARSTANNGNQSKSDLSEVFKKVLDTAQAGDVSILLTDGVFSPEQHVDARQFLDQQKFGLKNLFSEKLKSREFATLILQFYSGFQGTYYYQDNTNKKGTFKDRPYYIICFGDEAALRNLLRKTVQGNGYAGFREYMLITPMPAYEVSPAVRDFEEYYVYDHEQPLTVTHCRKGGPDNKFRIKLRADFSGLPLNEVYLSNPENYVLSPGYTLQSVKAQEQGKATHELVLAAAAPKTGILTLSLKRTLPQWVTDSNLDEDRQLSPEQLEGKTFGIRYLLGGIYDAYYTKQASPFYYTISISVKE